MKYSLQREMVLKILRQNMVHPTAERVYELLKKEMPNVSLATVYRNLNILAENGIIRKIEGLDDCVRFDASVSPHYHFICTKCNKVYDVPYNIVPNPAANIERETGFIVESCDISYKGICKECQK